MLLSPRGSPILRKVCYFYIYFSTLNIHFFFFWLYDKKNYADKGTIDIPISETVIMNRQRMKLRPVQPYSPTQSSSYNYRGKSSKAVTHYKVCYFLFFTSFSVKAGSEIIASCFKILNIYFFNH